MTLAGRVDVLGADGGARVAGLQEGGVYALAAHWSVLLHLLFSSEKRGKKKKERGSRNSPPRVPSQVGGWLTLVWALGRAVMGCAGLGSVSVSHGPKPLGLGWGGEQGWIYLSVVRSLRRGGGAAPACRTEECVSEREAVPELEGWAGVSAGPLCKPCGAERGSE